MERGVFLSTPSARRATFGVIHDVFDNAISIHALREEGDRGLFLHRLFIGISIHALREEGDRSSTAARRKPLSFLSTPSARRATLDHAPHLSAQLENFYPRPPRGGRPPSSGPCTFLTVFLSTPSARRATAVNLIEGTHTLFLSTPSARRATPSLPFVALAVIFLSTPSARRATSLSNNFSAAFVFLSTPSARRATPGFGHLVVYY